MVSGGRARRQDDGVRHAPSRAAPPVDPLPATTSEAPGRTSDVPVLGVHLCPQIRRTEPEPTPPYVVDAGLTMSCASFSSS
jgi:hypothetical protein